MMKNYGKLVIGAPSPTAPDVIRAIDQSLPVASGWRRNQELEQRLASRGSRLYCFSCEERQDRRAANLWLAAEESNLRVTNIVPTEDSLGYNEYNAILRDFSETALRPLVQSGNLTYRLSIEELHLHDFLSEETERLLYRFAGCSNKATGASHPQDQERWHAFLVAAYKDPSNRLSPHLLARWLHEEEEFPEDIAMGLATDYENALALLKHYAESAA